MIRRVVEMLSASGPPRLAPTVELAAEALIALLAPCAVVLVQLAGVLFAPLAVVLVGRVVRRRVGRCTVAAMVAEESGIHGKG